MRRFRDIQLSHINGCGCPACIYAALLLAVLQLTPLVPSASSVCLTGLFFDECGTVNCDSSAVGVPVTTYLLVKNVSDPTGVIAWQCSISHDESIYVLGCLIRGNAINVGSGGNYIVGLAEPLPTAPVMVLAEYQVLALAGGGMSVDYLNGGPLLNPGFVAAENPNVITEMYVEYGGLGIASISFGPLACPRSNASTSPPVREECASWSAVKCVFR